MADALIVSEARRKTLAALHRELLDPPSDQYALADCFRESPWTAEQVRSRLLVYLVRLAVRLARLLHLEKIIFISFDDSLCPKDPAKRYLEAVDWHHDHNSSSKKHPVYRNGSVFLLCRLQIGFIQFTINWRLSLRRKTVRRLNSKRPASRATLLRQQVHAGAADVGRATPSPAGGLHRLRARRQLVQCGQIDHLHSSPGLARHLRPQVQPGRPPVVRRQVRQWAKELRYTPYTRVRVKAADGTVTQYLVRTLTGRLKRVPFDVCVECRNLTNSRNIIII
jgi:hypothetical protein